MSSEKIKSRRLYLLDTTLRDGDQSPGFAFSRDEKVAIARQLDKLCVDVIEAGFPASSKSQFEDVQAVCDAVQRASVSAMARAVPEDIIKAGRAISRAKKRVLHTSLATSPIHREWKLRMSTDEVIACAVEAVRCARSITEHVEIGAEDAARTEIGFLEEYCHAVIEAGASVVNISDTVGYMQPDEYGALIGHLKQSIPSFASGAVQLSVHCHNDLGLAVANTLAGIAAGAHQAEVTILGIGERAGNAPLEEVVMALKTREKYYGRRYTHVDASEICNTTRIVSRLSGYCIPVTKPIAGSNVFKHGSGIHQNGIVRNASTYTLFDPQDIGGGETTISLSRHSGRSGIHERIREITGRALNESMVRQVNDEIKILAESKKNVSATDLLLALHRCGAQAGNVYSVKEVRVNYDYSGDGFDIGITLIDQDAVVSRIAGHGNGKMSTIVEMLKARTGTMIAVTGFTCGFTGTMSVQTGRVEVTAMCEGIEYVDESFGSDHDLLLAESLCNIINTVNAKAERGRQ